MAKETGLGDRFYLDGFNLSGNVASLDRIYGGPTPLDLTDITQSAPFRLGGKRDGGIEFHSWFDSTLEHPALSTLPLTDRVAIYGHGAVLGNEGAGCISKQLNYDMTRGDDGSLSLACSVVGNGYGLMWGRQLTAGPRSDGTATNGVGVDFAASTSFGWQAFLSVQSFTGTSVTVTVKDSADNVTFAAFTGSAFTAATAAGAQFLIGTPTATVRQYVRVDTSGTFSQATFTVLFVKNPVATVF